MKIRWSPTAVADIETIRDYIAKDSPSAARKIANRIKESVNRLANFPFVGQNWARTWNARVGYP
jgi:plasmid stabilization system protein ParE